MCYMIAIILKKDFIWLDKNFVIWSVIFPSYENFIGELNKIQFVEQFVQLTTPLAVIK